MGRDPKARYLMYVVASTGFTAAVAHVGLAKPNHMLLLFLFTLAAEAFPIAIPAIRGSVSLSFIPIFVTVLSQGPLAGMLVATLGTVRPEDFGGVPKRAVIFNRIQLGAAAGVSGFTFHWLAGQQSITDPRFVASFAAASALYFVTNIGLSIIYLHHFGKIGVGKLVHQFKTTVALNYLALMSLFH
ncbi:hypothetical protein [Thermaerobacter litoralis]